ncbi:hypothetical protein [Cobetia sp. QF-1]|uniref:DUF6998 domain-containing protein n=1 Tax=Cobetia sp. QF-1 TaxID=1969833 RepID=UPI000B53AF00|nr:hypothetical protein [Cobetia sp. QF-1]
MDKNKLKSLVGDLYNIVNELEEMFPGRHFTPDGHMVGSLGECLVANAYDLELLTASNKGYDAIAKCGTKIEIKATQAKSVAFCSEPEHAIVINILPDGSFEEIYNGLGSLVWQQFSEKKLPSNGQFQISIRKLKYLNFQVDSNDRVKPKRTGGRSLRN